MTHTMTYEDGDAVRLNTTICRPDGHGNWMLRVRGNRGYCLIGPMHEDWFDWPLPLPGPEKPPAIGGVVVVGSGDAEVDHLITHIREQGNKNQWLNAASAAQDLANRCLRLFKSVSGQGSR